MNLTKEKIQKCNFQMNGSIWEDKTFQLFADAGNFGVYVTIEIDLPYHYNENTDQETKFSIKRVDVYTSKKDHENLLISEDVKFELLEIAKDFYLEKNPFEDYIEDHYRRFFDC